MVVRFLAGKKWDFWCDPPKKKKHTPGGVRKNGLHNGVEIQKI